MMLDTQKRNGENSAFQYSGNKITKENSTMSQQDILRMNKWINDV